MSKRIANCKGRTTARYGRIRIGWRKRRMLSLMEKQQEQLDIGKLDAAAKEAFKSFKLKVKKLIPKQLFRRTQSR